VPETVLRCVLGLAVMIGTLGLAQSPPSQASQPDNTKVNQRDRDQSEPTADQQKENKSDRETARKIRKAIVEDKSLSTYAHNVKIIAQNGTVTLKGPVRSADEKQKVEKIAGKIAGAKKVKSEIQVTGEQEAGR
jgi:hyperosmotically inducible periplasmic protein